MLIRRGRALNLGFELARERVGALHGLLGPYLDEPTRIADTRDGQQLDGAALEDYDTLYRTLGDSWRITDEESLFDYPAGESTVTFTDPAFPDPDPWAPSDAERSAAQAACERLGVPADALPGCIFDVAETGDPGWAVTTASFLAGFRPTLAGLGVPLAAPPADRLTVFPIAAGERASGEIDAANARHVYELQGTAGESIYLRALEPCEPGRLVWQVRHPSGGPVGAIPDACLDLGRVDLDVEGVYRIEVWSLRRELGSYAFEVVASEDEQVRSVAVGDTVSGSIDVPGARHVYELAGRAGDVVYLRAAEPCDSTGLLWQVLDPSGVGVGGGIPDTCLDFGRIEFPADGTYRIQVGSLSDATGGYGFEVLASVPVQVRQTAVGERVSGRVELPGERHAYDLAARAGDVLYLRAGDACEVGLAWWLLDPAGVAIHGGIPNTCLDIGSVELSVDGVYRIEIWSLRDGTGPYEFTIERE